jgi:hypothetical protein
MSPTSRSSLIYAFLLRFYPEDLRRRHGLEMMLVFAEDLAAARLDGGLPGALRVWRWTANEFLRLALPAWLSTPAVRVPAISLAMFAAMALSMLPGGFGYGVRFFLILPLFSTPFLALLSFWACRRNRVDSVVDCSVAGRNTRREYAPCSNLAN